MSRIELLIKTDLIRTILFNFHYFPFSKALRLPVFLGWHMSMIKRQGEIMLGCPPRPGIIRIGYLGTGTQDTKYDRTKWELRGKILFSGTAEIGRGSSLSVSGTMSLGDGFIMTGGSTVICADRIECGNNVLMSWDCLLMDTDFHPIYGIPDGQRVNDNRPILIKDNVWIGCRSTILKGTVIPEHSVVAAGSVLSRKFSEPHCILGGSNGGGIIKKEIYWKL